MMDIVLQWAQSLGVGGLILVSVIESIFSPILPDFILIPLALAKPEKAIYYAIIATLASVFGGIFGYGIGQKIGASAVQRFVPAKYITRMEALFEKYGGWAIFIGAISPIPYKFISITAGTFGVNKPVFLVSSLLGRAKRFLLEGLLIYYYGPRALGIFQQYDQHILFIPLIAIFLIGAIMYTVKQIKATGLSTERL